MKWSFGNTWRVSECMAEWECEIICLSKSTCRQYSFEQIAHFTIRPKCFLLWTLHAPRLKKALSQNSHLCFFSLSLEWIFICSLRVFLEKNLIPHMLQTLFRTRSPLCDFSCVFRNSGLYVIFANFMKQILNVYKGIYVYIYTLTTKGTHQRPG